MLKDSMIKDKEWVVQMFPKFQLLNRQCFHCGLFLPMVYADLLFIKVFVYLRTNQENVLPLNLVCREEN